MAIMKYLHIFNWWEKQIIYKVKKSILQELSKNIKILSSLAIASIDTYDALNNINILGNNKVESLGNATLYDQFACQVDNYGFSTYK